MQNRSSKLKYTFALLALVLMFTGLPVHAQEEAEDTTNTLLSERAFQSLEKAQKAYTEKRYADALAKLAQMEKGLRLSPYEQALVFQTYGFVYLDQENYPQALGYFEKCLGLKALPLKAQQGMLYSLAGLYAQQERWNKVIETMERWLPGETDPPGDAFVLIGSAYAQMDRYADAIPWIKKAIDKSPDPKESWYQLLTAMYFELKQFRNAANTSRTMVGRWPEKRNYWEMLSGALQESGDDVGAMTAMDLAYRKGVITEEPKLLNLIRMKMFLQVPYQAGAMLDKEIKSGRISNTQKNLELLLAAWEAAREFDKAVNVIDQIAPMTSTGDYDMRKAQLFLEKNNWEKVVEAAQAANNRGGLKDPSKGYLFLGMAYLEQGNLDKAEEAFKQCREMGSRSAKSANGWLDFIRDRRNSIAEKKAREEERRRELEAKAKEEQES